MSLESNPAERYVIHNAWIAKVASKQEKQWPPADYTRVFRERQIRLRELRKDLRKVKGAWEYYRTRCPEFLTDWATIYEPRAAFDASKPTSIPFILFPRQKELVQFLLECLKDQEAGLVEKSRDMGATWICVWVSIWLWLFWPGAHIGWGSRKAHLVDDIGDPDTIFEKIRQGIRGLPAFFHPKGFSTKEHMSSMKIINPENGATITGEGGDNIGRGGRSLIYFKDEAQPLYSRILTPHGWKTMRDMRVGSEVIGADGRTCKVTQIKNFKECIVCRIGFTDGTYADCSPNHLWQVEKWQGKKQTLILSTKDLTVNHKGRHHFNYRINTCSPIHFARCAKHELHPYLVGALLGDGCIVKGTPRFSTADEEIAEAFRTLLPGYCRVKKGSKYGYSICDARGRYGRAKSRARMLVVNAGIYGKTAKCKFVPDKYKFSSIESRLALLQGLLDTDGSASGKAILFRSGSRQLAEDVQFLVQSLGGTATLRGGNSIPKHGTMPMFAVNICMPVGIAAFRLARKQILVNRKHPPGRTICSVKVVGKEVTRCISVDAKDGLYLTDHCIITHNSAHYEHPELIEAALSHNTAVPIDISSVHGTGNLFHNKREAGVEWYPSASLPKGRTRVFVFDWRDHPGKDQEWYELGRAQKEREGLLHIWAQEVDRDYAAAVEGVIIPGIWVRAAIDAHLALNVDEDGSYCAALDVADEGGDTNALVARRGIVLTHAEEWGARDTGVTTRKAIALCRNMGEVELQYDCVGVGAGIKSEANRLKDDGHFPNNIYLVPWNGGAEVVDKDKPMIPHDRESPKNGDFFQNMKAQAWWALRRRFEITYRALNEPGFTWDTDDIISIPSSLPLLRKLEKELSQPTIGQSTRLKLLVDKKPDGMKSPNLADAVVMCFYPVKAKRGLKISDRVMRWAGLPEVGRMRR